MLSSVALGIVKKQMQFATGVVPPLLNMLVGQSHNCVVDKACRMNDLPCGKKFTRANSFRLEKTVSIGPLAHIIRHTLRGSFSSIDIACERRKEANRAPGREGTRSMGQAEPAMPDRKQWPPRPDEPKEAPEEGRRRNLAN
jgi:hypothetical protein